MREEKSQKKPSVQDKGKKYLPDTIDKDKLRKVFISSNMNIEICALECGISIEDMTTYVVEEYEEIKLWKEVIHVKVATNAFNTLIEIAMNEEKDIKEEDSSDKYRKYTPDAQVKSINSILDRIGYKIGLSTKNVQKKQEPAPTIKFMDALSFIKEEENNQQNDED